MKPIDWVNELGILSQHPDPMPLWVRGGISTIYKGLSKSLAPKAEYDADTLRIFIEDQ